MALAEPAPVRKLNIDDIYAKLVALGHGQTQEEVQCRMAALVLLLVNHIGDQTVVEAAIETVKTMPGAARQSKS